MAIDSKHPEYATFLEKWVRLRDSADGEDNVKREAQKYLPPTTSMVLDGMGSIKKQGQIDYDNYKLRAVFPELVSEAVELLLGIMHQKPPVIEVPDRMKFVLERMSPEGEPAEVFLRRINAEQLITGRLGLLVDLPANPDPVNLEPYVALYTAESVINWNDQKSKTTENRELIMTVLDESGHAIMDDNFEWKNITQYRVLQLLDKKYVQGVFGDGDDVPDSYMVTAMQPPMMRGKALDEIPFIFINTSDLSTTPEKPPLLSLCALAYTIYRGEADYRQNLHMQGQDTLIIVGGISNPDAVPGQDTDAIRTGAGARIDVDVGGDAKYIGVQGAGLTEQRSALENDYAKASSKTGHLLSSSANDSSNNESGVAKGMRLTASTATLNQIAKTGAAGLQAALRLMARWLGYDESKVVVTPNVEFADFSIEAQELVQLMTARNLGFPLSKQSMHALAVEKGLTVLTYEEEQDVIDEEDAAVRKVTQEDQQFQVDLNNADPPAGE